MTTAAAREQSLEKHIQKHMGCMAGFLHIFDRHHFLFGKRFYSAKRLPPSPVAGDTTPEKSSSPSPAIFTETESEGNRSARRMSSYCEFLKKCCETLTEENRRLHELKALKSAHPLYMQQPARDSHNVSVVREDRRRRRRRRRRKRSGEERLCHGTQAALLQPLHEFVGGLLIGSVVHKGSRRFCSYRTELSVL